MIAWHSWTSFRKKNICILLRQTDRQTDRFSQGTKQAFRKTKVISENAHPIDIVNCLSSVKIWVNSQSLCSKEVLSPRVLFMTKLLHWGYLVGALKVILQVLQHVSPQKCSVDFNHNHYVLSILTSEQVLRKM